MAHLFGVHAAVSSRDTPEDTKRERERHTHTHTHTHAQLRTIIALLSIKFALRSGSRFPKAPFCAVSR